MLTPAQHRLLRVAVKQLRLDDDSWRAVLRNHGQVESATALDNAGFDRVLQYLKAQGFAPKLNRRRSFGERPGFASPGQVGRIQAMWREYTGRDDPAALDTWLEHKFHVTALRFATPTIARNAITGLKKMTARKAAAAISGESPPSPAA